MKLCTVNMKNLKKKNPQIQLAIQVHQMHLILVFGTVIYSANNKTKSSEIIISELLIYSKIKYQSRLGSDKASKTLFSFISASISEDFLGASADKFTGPFLVIKISSSIRTAIPHHFLSQSLPTGI